MYRTNEKPENSPQALTLEAAKTLRAGQTIWHMALRNGDGTALRVRVTSVKTWKTRPGEVLVGAKYGLRNYLRIDETTLDAWAITEPMYASVRARAERSERRSQARIPRTGTTLPDSE